VDLKKVALFFSGVESDHTFGHALYALGLYKVALPFLFITDYQTSVMLSGIAAVANALIAIVLFQYSQKK
jgi:hypothetical protein